MLSSKPEAYNYVKQVEKVSSHCCAAKSINKKVVRALRSYLFPKEALPCREVGALEQSVLENTFDTS